MSDIVIAIIFDEDEFSNSMKLGEVIDRAQKVGKDIPNVKIQMARGDAAQTIKFFCNTGELPVDEEMPQDKSPNEETT